MMAPLRLLVLNLLALGVLGVTMCAWVLFYTDAFPVVGGLLGLGGVFAWVGFISGLVRRERKDEMQLAFERAVLLRRRTLLLTVALGALFVIGISGFGTVVLDTTADEHDRLVRIATDPEQLDDDTPLAVSPRAVHKRLTFTGWGRRDVWVDPSGLPARSVTLGPLTRHRLALPSSFRSRPLVLARPEPVVSANAARPTDDPAAPAFALVVRRNGEELASVDATVYRGEALWIGCSDDVAVPPRLRDRWQLMLIRENLPDAVTMLWSSPLAVAPHTLLEPGDRIEVDVIHGDGRLYARGILPRLGPLTGDGTTLDIRELILRRVPVDPS